MKNNCPSGMTMRNGVCQENKYAVGGPMRKHSGNTPRKHSGNTTFEHSGDDCYSSCENYWIPRCQECSGCTNYGCPSGCECFHTCNMWISIWDPPDYYCAEWTYCANPGSCYDDFQDCLVDCPGGGYTGKYGGSRGTGTGRGGRKGGLIRRKR